MDANDKAAKQASGAADESGSGRTSAVQRIAVLIHCLSAAMLVGMGVGSIITRQFPPVAVAQLILLAAIHLLAGAYRR